jgi:hypothetical protein
LSAAWSFSPLRRFFETAGRSSTPAGLRSNAYRGGDGRSGGERRQLALGDQKEKSHDRAVTLLSVLSAERQISNGDNFRLCLSLDRRGRTDTARIVVHRNQKQQWSVALWAWGACGKRWLKSSFRFSVSRSLSLQSDVVRQLNRADEHPPVSISPVRAASPIA